MNLFKIKFVIVIFLLVFSTISYAEQSPPINDICIYPIYTGQQFSIAWTHEHTGMTYIIEAVNYVNGKKLTLLTTTEMEADVVINESGIWEMRIVVSAYPDTYASTLNENTCIVDTVPQKWIIYTSPAPPGDPIFD